MMQMKVDFTSENRDQKDNPSLIYLKIKETRKNLVKSAW